MNDYPAFPTQESNYEKVWSSTGMGLRDYFAIKYVQGARSNPNSIYELQDLVDEAYEVADLMIAYRSK